MQRTLIEGYTVEAAASRLVVREDSLLALLPDTAIAVERGPLQRLTLAEIGLLERFICGIREIYAESVYGGGAL